MNSPEYQQAEKQPVVVYQLRKAGFTDLDIGMTLINLEKEGELKVPFSRYVGKKVARRKEIAEVEWLKGNIHFQYGPFRKFKHDKVWEIFADAMHWESLFARMHIEFGLTAIQMPVPAKKGEIFTFFVGARSSGPKGMSLSQLLSHDLENFANEELAEIEAQGYSIQSY